MTKEQLAESLSGKEYPFSVGVDLLTQAKRDGLVIVYGASDDLMEFGGAIAEEIGCYEGGYALILDGDLFEDPNCDCKWAEKAVADAKSRGRKIEAIWGKDGYCWQYKTDIPHATFEILEEGNTYCRGIVFALADAA